MNPKVSIIMGVYNCAETLSESIESIINQSFTNWEFIICDDGSTDNTYEIASSYVVEYKDKIVLLKNEKNKGLNYTLNKCLEISKGKYIARMDGDDVSIFTRLEKEVNVLDNNSDISIVSSSMIYFDEEGDWGRYDSIEYPEKNDFIQGTPFCHAPCMVRREAYLEVQGYTESKMLLRMEDYHLWIKMYSKGYKGFNIKKPLYKMRDDRDAFKRRKFKYRLNEAYVRFLAFKMLKLNKFKIFIILRPILIGMIPYRVYKTIHRYKLRNI